MQSEGVVLRDESGAKLDPERVEPHLADVVGRSIDRLANGGLLV